MIPTRIWDVRVGDYVSYTFETALSSINRENGKITISAESDLEPWFVPTQVQPKLIEFAQSYSFPEGVSFEAGWENAENSDLIRSTLISFVIAIFLIYGILVFQFNSFSQPAIILYSVVLALMWVNIWLLLTGNPYSMPFAIWFIALTGIVVNDAIIFVDKINSLLGWVDHIKDLKWKTQDEYIEYIVQAGKTRLQPIIVTTLTTVFGVLPLALQDEFWAGLGYTVVFGLFAGSAMTLFVIPALYYELYLNKKLK